MNQLGDIAVLHTLNLQEDYAAEGQKGEEEKEIKRRGGRKIYIRRATFLARSLQGITISISIVLSIQGNYGNFEYSLILLLH